MNVLNQQCEIKEIRNSLFKRFNLRVHASIIFQSKKICRFHTIDLEGNGPPYDLLHNSSNTELINIACIFRRRLSEGVDSSFRHSLSPAGASVMFVPKKGREFAPLCGLQRIK